MSAAPLAMTHTIIRSLLSFAAMSLLGLSACGGVDDPAAPAPAGTSDLPTGPTDPDPSDPEPDPTEAELLDDLEVRVVPDTECVMTTSAGVELLAEENDALVPMFSRLVRVGDRLIAGNGASLPGFVSFDLDGALSDEAPMVMSEAGERIASEGAALGAVALDEGEVLYQRFDAFAEPLGPAVLAGLGEPRVTPEIAGGQDGALVIWGDAGALRARGFAAGEPAAEAFPLGSGDYAIAADVTAVYRDGTFGIAWTSNEGNGFSSHIAVAGLEGLSSAPVELVRTEEPHRIARLVATAGGFALLLTGPAPDAAPHVLLLGPDGSSDGLVHRLEGAHFGWDLASRDGELAVLTGRASGHPQFRTFDPSMSPNDGWACLGHPGSVADGGGLIAQEAGYGVTFRNPHTEDAIEGDQLFLQIDASGMAP